MHVHVHVHVCVCVCVLLRRCRLRMQVMPWRCTRTARARACVCVCACVHTCPLSPTPSPPGSTTFAARVHTTHHAPHANPCTDTLGTPTLQTCLLQKATSIGLGGQKDVLTGEQITALYKQMGITDNNQLQLCYNPKLHGYSSSTMHDRQQRQDLHAHAAQRQRAGVWRLHAHHPQKKLWLDSRKPRGPVALCSPAKGRESRDQPQVCRAQLRVLLSQLALHDMGRRPRPVLSATSSAAAVPTSATTVSQLVCTLCTCRQCMRTFNFIITF